MGEVTTVPTDELLLTDSELCEYIGISYATLHNHLTNGPPQRRHANVPDVRTIDFVVRGGRRRWLKTAVEKFLHG
jgi:hypothetical protein